MKLKEFLEQFKGFDLESEIIFGDKENYPYSFSDVDIAKLGIVDDHYVIDEVEEIEFDNDHPVKNVVLIKIDYGVFE